MTVSHDPDRPDRPVRSDRSDRSDRPDRPVRSDRPDDLLALAVELARRGGAVALEGRRATRGHATSRSKSSATDEVTEYDHAAEQAIVDHLATVRPHDAVIGEEGAARSGTSGYEWFLDPIDGTTNFVYDLPAWCTSVAVALHGQMVAGAVYVPVADETFAARAGGGATLDGVPLRCSPTREPALALVATGFGYDPALRTRQAARVHRLIGRIRDVRRLGSAAIDLCHVAAGRVDAYYEENLNSWDAAAGLLIATEAGAVASDFAGGPPRPEQLLVAGPGVHAGLRALIVDAAP